MTQEELNNQKQVEFYAASVGAWYNTSLERDKSVFTLSAGGIGLLLTLLTTVGVSSLWLLALYCGAIICFLVSIAAALTIFGRNRTYIEAMLGAKKPEPDTWLTRLDWTALCSFGVGAALTAILAITVAINSHSTKQRERDMSDQNKSKTDGLVPCLESYNGALRLKPSDDLGKSFNNVGNLRPQPAASAPAPTPAAAPTPTPNDPK